MSRKAVLIAVVLACGLVRGIETPEYKLGRAATAAEIRQRDISVAPDGTGLPPGRCSVESGRSLYKSLCANCHGDRGQGVGEYPALAGGRGTLKDKEPVLTVGSYWPYATTVWDYTRRAMPYQRPGSLTPNETYAVTAFILYMNGIIDEKMVLDKNSLPRIRMPNREGFLPDPRPDVNSGFQPAGEISDHGAVRPNGGGLPTAARQKEHSVPCRMIVNFSQEHTSKSLRISRPISWFHENYSRNPDVGTNVEPTVQVA